MTPDNTKSVENPHSEISLEDSLPFLRSVVRSAYRKYQCHYTQEDVEDYVNDVVLSLIKDGEHGLQSFEGRSSSKDWLRSVAYHQVLRSILGRKDMASLDDVTLDDIACPPTQEDEVWIKETKELLAEMAAELTEHERQVLEFMKQGLRTHEIAAQMGIAPNSVSKSKGRLLDKLAERLRLKLDGPSRKRSGSGKPSKNENPEN